MSDKESLIELQVRFLLFADRWPKILRAIVDKVQGNPRQYSVNEVLAAVDFLENRKLLELRTANNTQSKTLFVKVTKLVPKDLYGILAIVHELHGLSLT